MTKNTLQHIAIIMDGNRRWAKQNKLSALKGHRKAAYESIEPLCDACIDRHIPYLTLWAFSTENWKRDKREVEGLMMLFRETLAENISDLHKKGIKVQTIGDLSRFPQDIQEKITKGTKNTSKNSNLTLTIALNYGGRDEIARAVSCLLSKRQSSGDFTMVTPEEIEENLDTCSVPDPDMIIRTGGEKRLSGFLTWQSIYSELYFTDTLFPDFTPDKLQEAIEEYHNRQRRFGK